MFCSSGWDEKSIKGYYTLTSESLDRTDVPEEHQKKIPGNYNVPVTLLDRLARGITLKGTGGEYLLLDNYDFCPAFLRQYKANEKEVFAEKD